MNAGYHLGCGERKYVVEPFQGDGMGGEILDLAGGVEVGWGEAMALNQGAHTAVED